MCAYTDIKKKIIYNEVTISATVLAIIISFIIGGTSALLQSLIGWMIGFIPLYLIFRLGGIGAGDVKLMGVVGALGGPKLVIVSFWYTSIIGFVMALYLLIKEEQLLKGVPLFKTMFMNIFSKQKTTIVSEKYLTIPYGVAIVIGSYISFFLTVI